MDPVDAIAGVRRLRPGGLLTAAAVLLAIAAAPTMTASRAVAQAAGCQPDMDALAKRRMAAMQDLNLLAKAGKGKLDPGAACPKLRGLAVIEAQFSDYLTKNKDWCGVPDEVSQAIAASHAKTVKFAAQACNIASEMKKQQHQQQQASEAAQAARLPSGPL